MHEKINLSLRSISCLLSADELKISIVHERKHIGCVQFMCYNLNASIKRSVAVRCGQSHDLLRVLVVITHAFARYDSVYIVLGRKGAQSLRNINLCLTSHTIGKALPKSC